VSLFRRFFVGAGYSLAGATLHRVLISLAGIAIARLLGVQSYGVYVNVVAYVNLLMTFGLFGINAAFPAFLPVAMLEGEQRVRETVAAGLLISGTCLVVVAAVGWVTAPASASLLYHGLVATTWLRLALPYMAALALNTLLLSALYGFQEFRRYMFAMILLGALVAAGSIAGLWRGGLRGLLIGGTLAYGISALLVLPPIVRHCGGRLTVVGAPLRARARELAAFAVPAFLGGLSLAPAYWIGNLLLVRAGGATLSGYFGVASSLSQLVMFVPLTLAVPLLPMMSEVAAGGDRGRFSAFVARNARMVWCINLPLTIGIGVAAPVLVKVFFGARYAAATPAFTILACSNLLVALLGVAGAAFMARRRMWAGFAVNAAWLVTVLVLAVPLARRGPQGLAVALLGAYVINVPIVLALLRRYLDLGPLATRAGVMAAITLAGLGLVAFVPRLDLSWPVLLALAALGVAASAGLAWRFALDADDRLLATSTLARIVSRAAPGAAAAEPGGTST
jgi:O-antigen/teichoic acid export membrane protein